MFKYKRWRIVTYGFVMMLLFSCTEKKKEFYIVKSSETTTDYILQREFKLSPQVLYEVFTKPRSMKSWLPDNTRFSVNHRVGGYIGIVWPDQNNNIGIDGFFSGVNPPHSLSFKYRLTNESSNKFLKGLSTRDSLVIKIKAIDGGSALSLVDRVRNKTVKHNNRKLGDSIKAGVSWLEVFDLIEKNMIKEKFKALEVNIPGDLEVIYYKPFKGIFYGSSNGQIFASFYFEEGFFQGDALIELNYEEKKFFQANKDAFLDEYSKKVGESFFAFRDQRHIYEFQHIVETGRLVQKWREENK